jgi:hypothetical protein
MPPSIRNIQIIKMSCIECSQPEICWDGLCADCFWECDRAYSRSRRRDIDWIFQRRISVMMTIDGLPFEEAFFYTMQWRLRYVVSRHLGMTHDEAMERSQVTFSVRRVT